MAIDDILTKLPTNANLMDAIALAATETRVTPPIADGDVLRASGFAFMCPREEVLAGLYEVTRKETIGADLGLIFATGHGIHWMIQNLLLAKSSILLGQWSCLGCGWKHGSKPKGGVSGLGLKPHPGMCETCGKEAFIYEELYFKNSVYRIGGHPDGFLVLPNLPGIGILEIKSISPRGAWEVKTMPKMEHIVQVQIYMWLTGAQWCKILYMNKGDMGQRAYIEHHVARDESTIEIAKETLLGIFNGLKGGPVPEPICATHDCPRAKKCKLVKECFGLEGARELPVREETPDA